MPEETVEEFRARCIREQDERDAATHAASLAAAEAEAPPAEAKPSAKKTKTSEPAAGAADGGYVTRDSAAK